ncbi:MAG: hypothetical protein RDU89_11930 [bacterium]|nr:hypothetical protein [bacterium]
MRWLSRSRQSDSAGPPAGKQELLEAIAGGLEQVGVPHRRGGKTDIGIEETFVDAGWGSGRKRITYQAAILADEDARTVWMWEKTTEATKGLSFGAGAESHFQSGRTLFRKVKGVHRGLDGSTREYSVDLGAIVKAVRDAAVQGGWRLKTVLNRSRAEY